MFECDCVREGHTEPAQTRRIRETGSPCTQLEGQDGGWHRLPEPSGLRLRLATEPPHSWRPRGMGFHAANSSLRETIKLVWTIGDANMRNSDTQDRGAAGDAGL